MKKIQFGSFPIVDIDENERKCIDNYSIKSFADLITMNSQMRKTSRDIQQYITPDVILKYFKNNTVTSPSRNLSKEDNTEKVITLKKAFKSLQNFSKVLSGNAFYKDKVTYPIYIEHENKNGSNDYDFILLTNDLIQKEILDEISYSDSLSLTFLFLKDMLYPTTPLSDIGNSKNGDSYSIRSDIAKFIEFSKQNNIDPITAMIKLVKIAGMSKQKKGKNYTGLQKIIRSPINALNKSISHKFFKLFGGDRQTGQIKDINFLLNEIKHMKIAEFFDDTTPLNKAAHLPNDRNGVPSTIERQYIAQKTQDYNKILSLIDSLIHFNGITDVMKDEDDANIDTTIKLTDSSGQGQVDVDVDYTKLIGSVRNDYFESFLINLIQKLNNMQAKYFKDSGIFPKIYDRHLKDDGRLNLEKIADYERELQSIREKLDKLVIQGDPNNEADALRSDRRHAEMMIKDLRTANMFIDQETYKNEQAKANDAKFKSDLTYNIDSVQSELTGLLNEIESALYDKTTLQNIFDLIGNKNPFTLDQLTDLFEENNIFEFNIEQLTGAIYDSLETTMMQKSLELSDDPDINQSTSVSASDSSSARMKRFLETTRESTEKYIKNIIRSQLFLLFKRMGREYGTDTLINARKYAKLRTDNNVIIRKTANKPNNFKTYILSEELLLNLYDMLNYVDTQKYIVGLLAYPPSRINNELNIIKYLIKRLGLEDNPLFIINPKHQSVILSQPDFLSLTGTNIFSKISFRELEHMCKMDYNKLLWNNNQMFKSYNIQKTRDSINSMNDKIRRAEAELKMHKDAHAAALKDYNSIDKKDKAARKIAWDRVTKEAGYYNAALNGITKNQNKIDKNVQNMSNIQTSQNYATSNYQPEYEQVDKRDLPKRATLRKEYRKPMNDSNKKKKPWNNNNNNNNNNRYNNRYNNNNNNNKRR